MIYIEDDGQIRKLSTDTPFTPTHTPIKLWELATFSVDGLESLLNSTAYQLLIPTLPVYGEVIVEGAILWDEKAANTSGGTFTNGAWRQRTLNTKLDPNNLVTLASNTVTLPTAGNYLIRASAPAYNVLMHQTRLLKNGVLAATGTSEHAYTTSTQSRSTVTWVGSCNANDYFTLEHRCNTSGSANGLGVSDNWGVMIFAVMEVYKWT